jgi:hypothetical protein
LGVAGEEVGLGPVGEIVVSIVEDVEFVDDEALLTEFGASAIILTGHNIAIECPILRTEIIGGDNTNLSRHVIGDKVDIKTALSKAHVRLSRPDITGAETAFKPGFEIFWEAIARHEFLPPSNIFADKIDRIRKLFKLLRDGQTEAGDTDRHCLRE